MSLTQRMEEIAKDGNFQKRIVPRKKIVEQNGYTIEITAKLPTKNPPAIGTHFKECNRPNAKKEKLSYTDSTEAWYFNKETTEFARVFNNRDYGREYKRLGFNEADVKKEIIPYEFDLEKDAQEVFGYLDKNLEYQDGWINVDGGFHGVPPMEHENYKRAMEDKMELETYTWFYQNWVKVSVSGMSGLHVFSSELYSASLEHKRTTVTARQKLTLQNIITKHNLLPKEGQYTNFFGYGNGGIIKNENGQIKLRMRDY